MSLSAEDREEIKKLFADMLKPTEPPKEPPKEPPQEPPKEPPKEPKEEEKKPEIEKLKAELEHMRELQKVSMDLLKKVGFSDEEAEKKKQEEAEKKEREELKKQLSTLIN